MQDFTNTNILIQLIGFIAVCLMVAVFQSKKRKTLLTLQVCSTLLFSLHFLLLGAMTGSIMNLIGSARSFTFLKLGKNRNILYLLFFIFLFSIASILTWQGVKSLLPLIGMTFGTIAYWQTKPCRTRLITPLSTMPWFFYSLITGSYPGMLVEILVFTSTLVGIYRLDLPKKYKRKFMLST